MTNLTSLVLTRDWRVVTAVLFTAYLVGSIVVSWRARRTVEHRPLAERWAHRLRQCLVGVGGLLFIAPSLGPTDWLALCAFAPFALHPELKANFGWLLFPLTAPLSYWASGGFVLGFAQYVLPFAVLVFFALGKRTSEE